MRRFDRGDVAGLSPGLYIQSRPATAGPLAVLILEARFMTRLFVGVVAVGLLVPALALAATHRVPEDFATIRAAMVQKYQIEF